MSLIEDYGLESPARKLCLIVLSINDDNNIKEMDVLHINKVIRYYEYLTQTSDVIFTNFKLGAVSYELEESIEILEELGMIEMVKKNTYNLTSIGEDAVNELLRKMDNSNLLKMEFSKKILNDLNFEEVLYFMYKVLPETQVNSIQFDRLEKKKTKIIKSLFHKGKISEKIASKWLESLDVDLKQLLE